MSRILRPSVLVPIGIIGVLVVALGLSLFQPWRLLTSTEVNEAVPVSGGEVAVATPTAAPTPSATPTAAPTPSATPTAAPSPATATPTPDAEPLVLAEGAFISHEHATSGSVRILELADGTRVLRVEDLQTSDGPDLQVWLSDQPVIDGVEGWGVFDDGAYAELGALKGNVGNQNYAIPAEVDLDDFTAVSIWCARFKVSFGAAELRVAA